MKKVNFIIIAFIILFSLTACGNKGSDDPNIGIWNAVSATMLDITGDVEEIYEKGASLELKANEDFIVMLDGAKIKGKWEYKEGELILSSKDVDFSGNIESGMLTLINMMDIGLDMTFEKEGGYSGGEASKSKGDAGYYILEKALEDGVTITAEEIKSSGMSAYVLLNDDGTFITSFGIDDIDKGIWEKGVLNFQDENGDIEGTIEYKLVKAELTIDWGEGFIATYLRSNEIPPAVEDLDETESVDKDSSEKLSELQKKWDGEWYGYFETHSVTEKYSYYEDLILDCYAKIKMNADDTGTIYLWETSEDLATVDIMVSKEGGSGEMGAAISESGHYWSGVEIGHADWIIDPSIYEYDNYMVIDGRYEDESGEGFYYLAHLRPWSETWDDIPENLRPPWYGWYLNNYTEESMVETLIDYNNSRVHSELDYVSSVKKDTNSGSNKDGIGDISGERINTGIISALCPDGWKSYDVTDYFSDDDAVDLTRLEFHRGAETEDDKFFKAGVNIDYFDKNSYFSEPKPSDYGAENFEILEDKEFSGRTWQGFIDLDTSSTYIWTKEADYYLSAVIYIASDEDSISIEDPEVEAIIASIGIQ